MMDQLTVKDVTKKYRRQVILDNISFTLAPTKIYGLLGRNGAGKTTLLNIISNRIFPTSGEVNLGGQNINNNDELLSKVFLMSEANLYSRQMKISQTFDLADAAYGDFNYDLAKRLLKVFNLEDTMKVTNLSTGQRTASKLIVALAVNADYILLDESILGLDANHREAFYKELVKTYQERPRTFVLSTHLIEEIQQLVEHVLILDHHQLIIDEDTENLLTKAYAISGPEKMVDEYTKNLNILKTEMMGKIKTAYLLDDLDEQRVIPDQVKINHYDLQHLFIYLTDGGEY
nr:ABC transporter ATP-binding protein [Limosilactobacillus reuteri]